MDRLLDVDQPLWDQDIDVTPDALDRIVTETHGCPCFVQELGKHAREAAEASPISKQRLA